MYGQRDNEAGGMARSRHGAYAMARESVGRCGWQLSFGGGSLVGCKEKGTALRLSPVGGLSVNKPVAYGVNRTAEEKEP